jgi:hypothetical protein
MNFHPPYFTKGNKKEKFLLKQVLIKIPQLGLPDALSVNVVRFRRSKTVTQQRFLIHQRGDITFFDKRKKKK